MSDFLYYLPNVDSPNSNPVTGGIGMGNTGGVADSLPPVTTGLTRDEINGMIATQLRTLNDRIIVASGQIQSQNFITGVQGWQINSDGNVEFGNGTFRGTITATTGFIGGFTIGPTTISASGLSFDSSIPSITVGSGGNAIVLNGATGVISSTGNDWTLHGDGSTTGFAEPYQQDVLLLATSISIPVFQIVSDPSDGTMFVAYATATNGTNPSIARFAKDTLGKYYKTHSVNISGSINDFGNNTTGAGSGGGVGVSVLGSFIYVSASTAANAARLARLDKADLANLTTMSYSGTAPSAAATAYNTSYTDGTSLYIQSTGTTWYRYTISGTTATNAATITQVATTLWSTSNGLSVYLSTEAGLFDTGLLTRTNFTGGSSSSQNRGGMFPIMPSNNMIGIVFADVTTMYLAAAYSVTNATAIVGVNIKLVPIIAF